MLIHLQLSAICFVRIVKITTENRFTPLVSRNRTLETHLGKKKQWSWQASRRDRLDEKGQKVTPPLEGARVAFATFSSHGSAAVLTAFSDHSN